MAGQLACPSDSVLADVLGKTLIMSEAAGIFCKGAAQGTPMKMAGRVNAAILEPATSVDCHSEADCSRILYTPLTRAIALKGDQYGRSGTLVGR